MEAQDKRRNPHRRLLYQHQKPTFIDLLNVVDEPLATLPRPPKSALDALMATLK
jgi:hypothetical protein